jgi:hypothetical protein
MENASLISRHAVALMALLLSLDSGIALAAAGGCPAPTEAPDTGTHIESATKPLGVDIGKAGDTLESRMVFFGQLSTEEKSDVCSHCNAAKAGINSLSADEKSFCQAILAVN